MLLYTFIYMHLNSNDIFEQIGLVVNPNKSNFERSFTYSVFLEIQLSEGKHELLEINYDNPHQVASTFCKKHRLNQLAIQIVESKIIEAKKKEEEKIMNESSRRRSDEMVSSRRRRDEMGSSRRRIDEMERSLNRVVERKNNRSQERIERRGKEAEIKAISRSQSRNNKGEVKKKGASKSPAKIDSKVKAKNTTENRREKSNKGHSQVGLQLYNRAMVKNKLLQNQRMKEQELKSLQEQKQLTFQPKINPVSAKIVEFRRENPLPYYRPQKQNKKQSMNQSRQLLQEEQMRECTFKPQINRVSDLIAQNNEAYSTEFDHFNALYRQAQIKKDKLNAEMEKSHIQLFQPKINTRSAAVITDTFEQRLQKSLMNKKKKEENQFAATQCSFKPKIGRAPKESHLNRQPESSVSLWDQLYSQKLKKCHTANELTDSTVIPITLSSATNFYYENLVEKRMTQVFNCLDGDQDGFISPENISIQNLSKNELMFLRPIFQEMDQLEAVLDINEFKKALSILLKESDPSSKGTFISEKRKIEEKELFKPQINSKSKQYLQSRVNNECIYDQLYQQGLKDLQKKEYRIQMEKAKQQEKELEGCSFKPQLNSTSKYYIEKVLGKKINLQFEDQSLN